MSFQFPLTPLAMALALGVSQFAYAAPVSADSKTQQQDVQINIPAGSLAQALSALGNQTGLAVSYPPELAEGVNVSGLKGRFTTEEALKTLLKNTNIKAEKRGPNAYALKRSFDSNKAITLSELVVKASPLGSVTEDTGAYVTGFMNAATGLNLSYRETPQSTSVVSNQVIEDQNLESVADALRVTPGIWVNPGEGGLTGVEARGFVLTSIQLDGLTASDVSTFSSYADFLTSYNTASVDHLEVVRGATGIMSGHGDPSGTVNIVRKRPTEEFKFSLESSVGNYGSWGGVIDLGSPLTTSGTVKGRIVASIDEQNDNIKKGDYNESRPALYGVLDAELSEQTTVSIALDYQEMNIDGQAYNAANPPAWDINGNDLDWSREINLGADWNFVDQHDQSAIISLVHNFSDNWRLRSSYALRDAEVNRGFVVVNDAPYDLNLGGFGASLTHSQSKTEVNSFNFVINGDFDAWGQNHELIVGYTNRQQKSNDTLSVVLDENGWPSGGFYSYDNFDPSSTISEPASWSEAQTLTYDTKEESVYANSQLAVSDDLSLLLGARLSNFEQDQGVGGPFAFEKPSSYSHKDIFLPYIGVMYGITDYLSAYASYTENFEIQISTVRDRSGELLDPKESKNYEAGLKAELLNDTLTASVALFRVNEDNVGVYEGSFVNALGLDQDYYTTQDGIETKGIELEVAGQITPNWQIMGGYTHQETTDNRDGEGSGGLRIQGFAEDLFKLSTRYQFNGDLSGLAIGGSVNWNGGYSAVRNFYNGGPNAPEYVTARQDAFALVGLWAGYQVNNHLSAQFNVSNVLDEKYRTALTRRTTYGEDRRFNLSVKYDF